MPITHFSGTNAETDAEYDFFDHNGNGSNGDGASPDGDGAGHSLHAKRKQALLHFINEEESHPFSGLAPIELSDIDQDPENPAELFVYDMPFLVVLPHEAEKLAIFFVAHYFINGIPKEAIEIIAHEQNIPIERAVALFREVRNVFEENTVDAVQLAIEMIVDLCHIDKKFNVKDKDVRAQLLSPGDPTEYQVTLGGETWYIYQTKSLI